MTENLTSSQLGDLIKTNKSAVFIGFAIALASVLIILGENIVEIFSINGKFNPIVFATQTIGFLLFWIIISLLVATLSVYKVLGVFALLVIVNSTVYLRLPVNNPITVPSLILFWLGIAYLLLPDFIKKYKRVIFGINGVVILYFYISRTAPDFAEVHIRIIGYFITLSVSLTVILWIYQQLNWLISVKLNQTHTELALLKSQVNPHFFFNTLNNLYGLVVEKSEQAPKVVLKLSDMMRYTIYDGKEDVVSLKDEITYLENYIELHKIRYQKKVDISFTHNVGENIEVAPLLFIILLENAFKHGVETIQKEAYIHLTMQSKNEQLTFTIENNFDNTVSKNQKGIGLDNLRKRLSYTYPDTHELIINESSNVYNVKLSLQLS
ncbi:MAG: sensor histidine kinase [Bacteroidota bacterium]